MNPMERLLLAVYSAALHLYPSAFRNKYAAQMSDAVRCSYTESNNRIRLAVTLLWDIVASALREHGRAATAGSPGYVAGFALIVTALLFTISVANQQILRRGADQQPQRLVSLWESRAVQGFEASAFDVPPQEISSEAWLRSPNVFVVLYDFAGHPIAGNATLHGALPQPPSGIFAYARAYGQHNVTWQPDWTIRVATVIRPLPAGGFILAGQSLFPSESREIRVHTTLIWMWIAMMAASTTLHLIARKRSDAHAASR